MKEELIKRETKVNCTATIRELPVDTWVELRLKDFAPIGTIRSAVSRLNAEEQAQGKYREYIYFCEPVFNGERVKLMKQTLNKQ